MSTSPPTPQPRRPPGTPLLGKKGLTATRAILIIASITVSVVLLSALVMRFFDKEGEFDSYGESVWWAVQTVTTVGYGDIVPTTPLGRFVAGIVMLIGVAFISMVSGVTASVLVDNLRRRRGMDQGQHILDRLDEISRRLEEMESRGPDASPGQVPGEGDS